MTFTPEQITLLTSAAMVLLSAIAYLCARKSGYHRGKSEVYREFAETYGALVPAHSLKDKEAKKRASFRQHMRLALIHPDIRDGLRSALAEADEHWASLDRVTEGVSVE